MSWEQIIRQPATWWTANNPTLLENQLGVESNIISGVETDTGYGKLGDGVTAWASLPYWDTGGRSAVGLLSSTVVATNDPNPQVLYTVPIGKLLVPTSWTWRNATASLAGLGVAWQLYANGVQFTLSSAAQCRLSVGANKYWFGAAMGAPPSPSLAAGGQDITFVMGADVSIVGSVTVDLCGYLVNE